MKRVKSLPAVTVVLSATLLVAAGCGEEKMVNAANLIERQGLKYKKNSAEPFTGTAIKYWNNTQKLWEVEWRDGKPHGEATSWDSNGQAVAKGEWRDGKKYGKWVFRHRNGEKASEGKYLDDYKDGQWIRWYDNGQKKEVAEYRNGELISRRVWDRSGNPI